ncbi:MAG: hypothetical protein WAL75_27190 [Terracidiphilus sp.]
MRVLKSISLVFILYLALSSSVSSQQRRPQSASSSCRKFVGEFYSWYLDKAAKEKVNRDGLVALKYRSYLFSPAIVRALQEDNEAQEKAGSDLVWLDADPFVGPDGFGEGYIVEKVTVRDGKCFAEVHTVWEGKEDEPPDVIPELAIRNGRWLFVNFYFPSPSNPKGWDLLGALKGMREDEKNGPDINRRP